MVLHRAGRVTATIATTAVLLLGLSSCVLIEGPTVEAPQRTPIEFPDDEPPEFVPDGTAEENHPYFYYVLQEFSETEAPVEGQPIVNAVAEAGFDKAAMQVSFDRSKTNLVADSIYVSVLIGEECLLGQIPTDTREVVTSVAAAVGPENNICLIGQTRPIDW